VSYPATRAAAWFSHMIRPSSSVWKIPTTAFSARDRNRFSAASGDRSNFRESVLLFVGAFLVLPLFGSRGHAVAERCRGSFLNDL
jgi:hypothetical protein